MKKFIVAILAALAVATLTQVVGTVVNYDMDFLAGWWSSMAFFAVWGGLRD